MNCRRIEKLIPLFVEGDLDTGATSAVSLHLNDCQNCSRIMSEYGESQNWLRTFAPPEFDNAFYVDLKQNVMQEIERKPARPTLIQRLTAPWNWNPTWATATALLLLACAFAFYLYTGKTKLDSPEGVISHDKQDQQKEQEQKESPPQPKNDERKRLNSFLPVNHKPKRVHPKPVQKFLEKLPLAMQQKTEPLENLAINIFDNAMIKMNPINPGEITDLPTSSESTRIEFQTGNPNIRIIWFAPKLNSSQSLKADTE